HNISTPDKLNSTVVVGYTCPSRRPPTTTKDVLSPLLQVTLSDYAAAHPCGYAEYAQATRYYPVGVNGTTDNAGTHRDHFFGCASSTNCVFKAPDNEGYFGAIVRGTKNRNPTTGGTNPTFTSAVSVTALTKMKDIEDGTSNTMLIGEKFVRPDL